MSEVVSGEAVVLDLPCARFPSRLIALLIDMLVQVIAGLAVVLIIIATGTRLDAATGMPTAGTANRP